MSEIVVVCCKFPDVAVTVIVEVVGLGLEVPPHPLSEPIPNTQAASSNSICKRRRFFQPMQHTRAARLAPGKIGNLAWVRTAAVAEAVSVRVDVALPSAAGVIEVGENTAVTPVGKPVAANVIGELKLFALVTVIVLVPLAPSFTVNVAGDAATVKLGGGVTVSAIVVVADSLPEVPVIATVAVPVAAALLAASVTTLLPLAGFVPNVAVTPLGRPEAARVTLPENPFTAAIVMVLVPLPPWIRLKVLGESESVKPGIAPALLLESVSANAIV